VDRFAVIRRFTAGNSEISRCFLLFRFRRIKEFCGFPATMPLFFAGKTAKNSGAPIAAPQLRIPGTARKRRPPGEDASRQLISP
jgi:hypothetical protein